MEELKTKKIGLVLSGGAARGAYQAGMLKALEELGISDNIEAIAGCSVGALNAMLFATGGWEAVYEKLLEFPDTFAASKILDDKTVRESKKLVRQGKVSLEEYISSPRFGQCILDKFAARLALIATDEKLRNLKRRLYACCYNLEKEEPEYFCLNGLSPDDQRLLIGASGSVPFLYPPVEYNAYHYLDGGLIPSICKSPAPPDKTPLKALYNDSVDAVIVNLIDLSDEADSRYMKPDVQYIQIRPSKVLEQETGADTMNFSPDNLKAYKDLGYYDTLKTFEDLK